MWKGRGVSEGGVLMWLCWDGGCVNCYMAVRMIGSDSESETGTGSDSVVESPAVILDITGDRVSRGLVLVLTLISLPPTVSIHPLAVRLQTPQHSRQWSTGQPRQLLCAVNKHVQHVVISRVSGHGTGSESLH